MPPRRRVVESADRRLAPDKRGEHLFPAAASDELTALSNRALCARMPQRGSDRMSFNAPPDINDVRLGSRAFVAQHRDRSSAHQAAIILIDRISASG